MNRSLTGKTVISITAVVVICGCLALAAGVLYSFKISAGRTTQYFLTVEEVLDRRSEVMNKNVRISGVVIGDSIEYDEAAQTLSFTIANVPADDRTVEELGGLERVLQEAADKPGNPRIGIVYAGPKPDLLRGKAQAILTGRLGEDGVFYAEEILLRCPTRYEEAVPEQVQ
jgi:cytochrome c-type biogenesis protein CcmE